MESTDSDSDSRDSSLRDQAESVQVSKASLNSSGQQVDSTMKTRGYIDGCFDLMHSGHYNAIRQARSLCDELVVGVCSDAEISRHKAQPILSQRERHALVEHIKWIDEVLYAAPYIPSVETLDSVNAHFCIHGDDIVRDATGHNIYDELIDAGRMKIVKRTEGVSTTDIVGRLLLLTKEHLSNSPEKAGIENMTSCVAASKAGSLDSDLADKQAGVKRPSRVIASARRMAEFSSRRQATMSDKVVYIDGAFDMFHVGHASTLKKAKALGSYLIVGIFDDETVNDMKGCNYPIVNLHERVLNVLACKWVDDVIIGCPKEVDVDLIKSLNISIVAQGSASSSTIKAESQGAFEQRNIVPKELGIFVEVQSEWPDLTSTEIARRVSVNRLAYIARNMKRTRMEDEYYQKKAFMTES